MKPLHELTPIGRGRRLRPVATDLLSKYDIEHAQLRQLTEASNTIFRVVAPNGDRYVLRMTAPKSCHGPAEIRSEIAWLRALKHDTDIGIPEPIARQDGTYVTEVDVAGATEPIYCALYRWVPGVMLVEQMTDVNMHRLGDLMAQLHEHAASYVPPEGFHIRRYASVFPYADPSFSRVEPVILFDRGSSAPLTSAQHGVYQRALDVIEEHVVELVAQTAQTRVIHNDLHVWNVKVNHTRLYALDFEDMMWGHPMQDIATTLYYFRWRDAYPSLLDAFRRGYVGIRAWPEQCDGQLEALIMGRMLLLANYVATSQDAEDIAFAPEYLARANDRLRRFLAALP
jgi:Ser/Thr protein kinase RdoA (MazF antagonist)